MNRRIMILITAIILFSIATVAVLTIVSAQRVHRHGNFLRLFPPHPVMEGDTLNIRYSNYYIAGGTPNTVYLANHTAPLHVLVVNLKNPTDTQHVHLNIKGIQDQKFWSIKLQVDSPYFYLSDGAVPIIYSGTTHSWHGSSYPMDSLYFRDIKPVTNESFIVKSLSGHTGQNILGKISQWPPYRDFKSNILEVQVDGVFCTDGFLHYDREQKVLVYLYLYRNQFMITDTSLNLMFRAHTIDTISKAKITVVESGSTKELASPPFVVNKRSCVINGMLFVNSNLRAKNELKGLFKDREVIDVYHLDDGRYAFSFYIYHFNGIQRMTDFRVFDSRMVVLYDKVLRVFELREKYFHHITEMVQ